MPQGERKHYETHEFRMSLPNINLLYIGCSVLILMDRTYIGRFWTQFEAWLAMQQATRLGLVSAPAGMRRYEIMCVHGAPEALKASLIEEWSTCTAVVAHEKLSRPDVVVTNQSDKTKQLPKLLALNEQVQDLMRSAEYSKGPGTPLGAYSS